MADDSNYSKREQDHFFTDIKERLEKQDAMLIKILDQATKTNGRVNKLEFWRNAIGWGFGVIMTIVLFTLNYIK
ncbi:MAG: hypothetical protein QG674_106 [Patescibacteria group bacterium]|jgi:hypothetical protein|nr:hypothetical protein [Patescibacteria group bacterium]